MTMLFDGTLFIPGGTNAPSLEAIALGLARRPRFAGQTSRPFNVLAHSFLVADLIEDPTVKVHGLLHDAAEAIVGDIPSTWKTEADVDREVEIICRIYKSLGLELPTVEEDGTVAFADHLALQAEATLLMPDAIADCGTGEIPRLMNCDPAVKKAADWIAIGDRDYWQPIWCQRVMAAVQKL